jgi:hypothetical protein
MMADNSNTESMNWRTTPEQKRLAKALEAILGKDDLGSLMRCLLQEAIDRHIPQEMQDRILGRPSKEDDLPKASTRR